MELIELRIADPRIQRLIRKWLTAGVSEDGQWSEMKVGTPDHRRRSMVSLVLDKVCIVSSPLARAVISPLLANIYLHYVRDQWVMEWRREFAKGDAVVVRYADDFVLGFQYRGEAERFLKQLWERMVEYGLELHPEKTRLIEFGRFAEANRERDGTRKPETFNFLGRPLAKKHGQACPG